MVLSLEPKRIIWGHFLDPDVRGSKVTRLQLQIVGILFVGIATSYRKARRWAHFQSHSLGCWSYPMLWHGAFLDEGPYSLASPEPSAGFLNEQD